MKSIFLFLFIAINPSFSKDIKLNSKIKQKTFDDVRFYIYLPTDKVVKGVIFNFPYKEDKELIEEALLSDTMEIFSLRGYAIVSWFTDVQPKSPSLEREYGMDGNELTSDLKFFRKKKWRPWLRKIEIGLSRLSKLYSLPKNGYICIVNCLSTYTTSRFIEYKPERFIGFVSVNPIGLFERTHESSHIFVHLDTEVNRTNYNLYHMDSVNSFDRASKEFCAPLTAIFRTTNHSVVYDITRYIVDTLENSRKVCSDATLNKSIKQQFLTDAQRSSFRYNILRHKIEELPSHNDSSKRLAYWIPAPYLKKSWELAISDMNNSYTIDFSE